MRDPLRRCLISFTFLSITVNAVGRCSGDFSVYDKLAVLCALSVSGIVTVLPTENHCHCIGMVYGLEVVWSMSMCCEDEWGEVIAGCPSIGPSVSILTVLISVACWYGAISSDTSI